MADAGRSLLGTSHRQAPVRELVGRVRRGLGELFDLPDGYEVVLGNGGSTLFWDIATSCLVRERAQHLVLGEFSAKFAAATTAAPFLADPSVLESPAGTPARSRAREDGIDVHAWPHNETSTGVWVPVERVPGTAHSRDGGPLVVVDGTSAAAGHRGRREPSATSTTSRRRRVSPRTAGSGWRSCRPAAVERAEQIAASGRWIPAGLDLMTAVTNSRLDQTYNTPAIGTLLMMDAQIALAGRARRPGLVDRALRGLGVPAVRLGRADALDDAVRRRPRAPLTGGRRPSTSRDERGRGGRGSDVAAQRDRGRRALPQARSQPAADRHVPGDRAGRRRGPHRRASTTSSSTSERAGPAATSSDRGRTGRQRAPRGHPAAIRELSLGAPSCTRRVAGVPPRRSALAGVRGGRLGSVGRAASAAGRATR